MDPLHMLFLVLIGAGAGFVQRVSGFGLGIFAMLFLPHFLPSHTAAAIAGLFSCVTSTYNAVRYRKNIAYKIALPLICAALLCTTIAVCFSNAVPVNVFKIVLGVMLILISVCFLVFQKGISIKPTFTNGLIAGALGGTLNGLFSTGGPPVVLFLSSATNDNITYFATIQFYFGVVNLYAAIIRGLNGIINIYVLLFAVVGIVGCVVGDFVGRKVFNRLNTKRLKKIIYIGMILSGAIMLLQNL